MFKRLSGDESNAKISIFIVNLQNALIKLTTDIKSIVRSIVEQTKNK